MSFRDYLIKKGLVETSIKRMEKQIERWLIWLNKSIEQSNYKDLMKYIDYLQVQNKSVDHINRNLITISHYYQYKELINPAIHTRLKGQLIKALPKLIKKEQLDQIYEQFSGSKLEKIILGLVIYLGLEQSDFLNIKVKDVDLKKGTIYISERTHRKSRILNLEAHQILPLRTFLFCGKHEDVPFSSERTSEKLFSPHCDKRDHFAYLLTKLIK